MVYCIPIIRTEAILEAKSAVQSVDRALDVIEAVAAAGEVGVTDLGRTLGLHVATVHNILRTLTARHYLLNHGGKYRVGPAVMALSSRWDPLHALPERVQPLLERISVETGEAASATVLIGFVARLVAFQPGTEAITIHFPQWVWPQALRLATGRLMVALSDQTRWEEFAAHSPDVRPEWSFEQWKVELQRLRDLGYCAIRTDRDGGQTLIAFPLLTRGGQPVAAIGAACPSFRATPERAAKMTASVHRAASELSRELGGQLPDVPPIDWAVLPMDTQLEVARP
jgi:DNA-binding IclR family transcriptional regulator